MKRIETFVCRPKNHFTMANVPKNNLNRASRWAADSSSDDEANELAIAKKRLAHKCKDLAKRRIIDVKLRSLRYRLATLKDGLSVEFLPRAEKLYRKCMEENETSTLWKEFEMSVADVERMKEIRATKEEFERKKTELMKNLVRDLEEEKQKLQSAVPLKSDKDAVSQNTRGGEERKLRRRPYDAQGKRTAPAQPASLAEMSFALKESEVAEDVRVIQESLAEQGVMDDNPTVARRYGFSRHHRNGPLTTFTRILPKMDFDF